MINKEIVLPQEVRDSGIKITPPQGCEVYKVEVIDGVLSVTFKAAERKLPKSWEEFCEMYPVKDGEYYIEDNCNIIKRQDVGEARFVNKDRNLLPDYDTAEAVLSLCQLIQLRNAYNGDWVPDWRKGCDTFTIEFECANITSERRTWCAASPLFFKTRELRDEFLRCFRPLIEKLRPLYGIKEGGDK